MRSRSLFLSLSIRLILSFNKTPAQVHIGRGKARQEKPATVTDYISLFHISLFSTRLSSLTVMRNHPFEPFPSYFIYFTLLYF